MNSTLLAAPLSSQRPALVGWTLESPGRGTLTLITTCASTLFLCNWVILHPRVHKRRWTAALHKQSLFLKGIFAPEFIAVEGLQEWSQNRHMVKECAEVTNGGLKMMHAFFIGMLAVRYKTDKGDKVIWPNQFTWLLKKGVIKWEQHEELGLSEKDIRDKDKADGMVKLVALIQVLWFVAQAIMRTSHSLPLSQLEALTLSYIPLFFVTYFFWWSKPKDVSSLTFLPLDLRREMTPEDFKEFEGLAVSDDFDDEKLPKQESLSIIWKLTPRVFEKEAELKAIAEQERQAELLAAEHPDTPRTGKTIDSTQISEDLEKTTSIKLPQQAAIVAQWDPKLYLSNIWPLICLFGAAFGALHLVCWNTIFPTFVEQWLWRTAAFTSIVSMLIFMHFEKVVLRWGGFLTMVSIISPGLYFLSRIVIIAGVFAALRASEPSIYDTYVVSSYWVHIL